MRLPSALVLLAIAAGAAGCGQHPARYALNDDGAPPPMEPQQLPPPAVPQDAPPAPAEEPDATPAPEVSTTAPEELTIATEPPEPVYEEPTPQPAATTIWVPGYWHAEGRGWTWYVGEWRSPPPGHVYSEPHYVRVGHRVVYVRGYWRAAATPPRSYGGTRIVFVRPQRPTDYNVRYQRPIRNVSGLPAGARLEPRYQPAPIVHKPRPVRVVAAPAAPASAPVVVTSAPLHVVRAPAPPPPERVAPPSSVVVAAPPAPPSSVVVAAPPAPPPPAAAPVKSPAPSTVTKKKKS